MTQKQTAWYWREWQAVMRHCKANNLTAPDRHEFHIRALGADKSSKKFSNADFDKVLREFWAVTKPDSVDAQMRQEKMPRTRLLVGIRERRDAYGLTEFTTLLRERFHTADFESLPDGQLAQLRDTLDARINARKQKTKAGPGGDFGSDDIGQARRESVAVVDGEPDWTV